MPPVLFTNVMIFDGEHDARSPGEVLVEDDKISKVAVGSARIDRAPGVEVVDGEGRTLMPGLVEGHAHVTYPFSVNRAPNISLMDFFQGKIPVETHSLIAAHNAGVLLESGFTSAYSAGGATLSMEPSVRDEIEQGWISGPRLRPSGNEGLPGALGHGEGMLDRSTTEADVREFIRACVAAKVDVVKFLLSGPGPAGPSDNTTMYTDDLLRAAGEEAREVGVWLSGHARPAEAIKQGLRNGWRVLYHCDGIDEEVLDLMEERKGEIFIGPSIGGPVQLMQAAIDKGHHGGLGANPFDPGHDLKAEVEKQVWNCHSMLDRGIRLLCGGDYGFPNLPHGHNARDLGYYVKYMGLSNFQALLTATKWGGELMDMPVGLIKEDYYADILLVDGDPLKDAGILSVPENIALVVKGGRAVIDRRVTTHP